MDKNNNDINETSFWGQSDILNMALEKIEKFENDNLKKGENFLSFYGLSGIGKSALCHEIIKLIQNSDDVNYIQNIYIDMRGYPDVFFWDLLKEQIELIYGEKRFPNYSNIKERIKKSNQWKTSIMEVAGDEILPDIIEAFSAIIMGKGISKAARYTYEGLKKIINNKNETKDDKQEKPFIDEIINDLIDLNAKVIICVDSFEEIKDNEKLKKEWIYETGGVIDSTQNVFWILSGEKNYRDAIELQPLSQDNINNWLISENIQLFNNDILQTIIEFTGGIPLLIRYCLDEMKDENFGRMLVGDMKALKRERVLYKCFNRYSFLTLEILGVMATLEEWTDSMIEYLLTEPLKYNNILKWRIDSGAIKLYYELKNKPLIRNDNNIHSFYKNITPYYQRLFVDGDKFEIYKYIYLFVLGEEGEEAVSITTLSRLIKWVNNIEILEIGIDDKKGLVKKILSLFWSRIEHAINYEKVELYYVVCMRALILSVKEKINFDKQSETTFNCMLYYANSKNFVDEEKLILQVQADVFRKEGKETQALAKDLCILYPNAEFRSATIPNPEVQNLIIEKDEDIVKAFWDSAKKIENRYKKAEIMSVYSRQFEYGCTDEVEYKEYWEILTQTIVEVIKDESVKTHLKSILLIAAMNSINSNQYGINRFSIDVSYFKDVLNYFDEYECSVSKIMQGEYQFQKGRYLMLVEDIQSAFNCFGKAIEYQLKNKHHLMWCHRARVNIIVNKSRNNQDDIEEISKDISYILSNPEEVTSNIYNSYLIIFCSLCIDTIELNKLLKDEELITFIKLVKKEVVIGIRGVCPNEITHAIANISFWLLENEYYDLYLDWSYFYFSRGAFEKKNHRYYEEQIKMYYNQSIVLYKAEGKEECLAIAADEIKAIKHTIKNIYKDLVILAEQMIRNLEQIITKLQ